MRRRLAVAFLLATLAAFPAAAFEGKPKFGPDAVPVTEATDYLRGSPAPDYWKLAAFYLPQQSSSACSVASVAMAVNFVRGLPPGAEDPLITQAGLLEAVADSAWTAETAEEGPGVRFDELVKAVREGLAAYGLAAATVEIFRPGDASPATMARLRAILSANEASDRDVVLAYFNQGVLTGDWDGPHVSPVGAFDAANGRVLVMDVDREWYVPYWSPDAQLLEAMLKPTGAEHGPLAGETGGLVWIKAPPP
jgi:hypothetical protein